MFKIKSLSKCSQVSANFLFFILYYKYITRGNSPKEVISLKKLFCFLLTLVLVLSLVGCDQAPAQPSTTIAPTTVVTEPAATEPAFEWYDENTVSITAQQVDRIVNMEFQKIECYNFFNNFY